MGITRGGAERHPPRRLPDELRGSAGSRPLLAAAVQPGFLPAGTDGRTDGDGLPRHSAGVRAVPQTPVRPLDAGRLPGLRERLRPDEIRHFGGSKPTDGAAAGRTTAAFPRESGASATARA